MEGAAAGVAREGYANQIGGRLSLLNTASATDFVTTLGGVFERSPWVAERAHKERPFANIATLHAAMVRVVEAATSSEQLALLRAHPELGGKEARTGRLMPSSKAEQSSAGLDALDAEEFARISRLTSEYHSKFGFPFIIAVRNYTKQEIFLELERRLANNAEMEMRICLDQVYDIAHLRLQAILAGERAVGSS